MLLHSVHQMPLCGGVLNNNKIIIINLTFFFVFYSSGVRVANQLKNCEASVGAACHSHIARASPLLLACGVPEDIAKNALRISIGRNTSKKDMDIFVADLKEAVSSLKGR